MNALSAIRKPRLILAALATAATLAVGTQLALSQAAPPRTDGPVAAPQLDGPGGPPGGAGVDGRGRRGFDVPGRPGPDGPGPGPRGAGRGRRGPGQGPGGQLGMPQRDSVDLSGTVSNYNFGPRGEVQALMIKTSDKTIQVNLPPPLSPFAVQVATVGAQVTINGYPEMGLPDHPIYELASVKNEQGRELKQPSPVDRKFVHEEGTIKSLNYARHGEINGAVLDSGDFVHLGPAAVTIKLIVGQKITVDGVGHPMMLSDHRAVEAVAIDGKLLERPNQPGAQGGPQDDRPRGAPDGPRGRRGGRGRGDPGGPRGEMGGSGGPDGLDGPGGPGGPGGPPNHPGPRRGGRGPGGRPDSADAPPPPPPNGRDENTPPPQINDEPVGQTLPDQQIPPIEP